MSRTRVETGAFEADVETIDAFRCWRCFETFTDSEEADATVVDRVFNGDGG